MANEFVHGTVGVSMTQAEFEAVGLHVLNSQATGDVIYASSATQLTRLGIGATNAVLTVIGGVPTWQTSLSGLTFVAPVLGAATATSINGLIITTTAGTLTIANSASAALITSGAYSITLTATAATSITLPTTGTLATLAGAETLTAKVSYNGLVVTPNTGVITTGTWNGTTIAVANGGTGVTASTGTVAVVLSTSPTLVTPILGVASATSLATSAATPLLLTNGQLVNIALTSQTVGATTLTIPNFASVVDTFVFTTLAQELDNKTLDSAVGKGTWTASGTWTIPAVTLGGIVSGGGYVVDNLGHIGVGAVSSTSYTVQVSETQLIADNVTRAGIWVDFGAYKTSAAFTSDIRGMSVKATVPAANTQTIAGLYSVVVDTRTINPVSTTYVVTTQAGIRILEANIEENTLATNSYGIYIDESGGPRRTNKYGIYIGNQYNGVTLNYAIYSAGGQSYHAGNWIMGASAKLYPTSGVMGLSVVSTALTLGSLGSVIIPQSAANATDALAGNVAGAICIDTTGAAERLYFRGASWFYIAKTGGLSMTREERISPEGHQFEIGDTVELVVDRINSDGSFHALPHFSLN